MSNNKQPLDLTDYDGISLVERWSRNVNAREKDDSWSIPGINSDEASTTTPISDPMGFLLSCAEKGGARVKQRLPTICKVSRILRDLSESSFTPQLVSIGPIHREPKLQEFEWMKECYLNDLLKLCNNIYSTPQKTLLEECLVMVNTLIPQIRDSYGGMIKKYTDDQVATMMVMDGCFILEFCFKHQNEDRDLPNKMQNLRIAMDLMLLENQVPFFVLQALFDCTMRTTPFTLNKVLDECLVPYINLFRPLLLEKNSILSNILDKYLAPNMKVFRSLLPGKISTTDIDSDLPNKNSTTDVDPDSTHDHVVGYLHKRYQLVAEASKIVDEEQAAKSSDPRENAAFHSIVDLDRSGMNFKPYQEGGWSMTIKFQSSLFVCLPWFKPTLLMPTLVIQDFTEVILRNFIAYEQWFPKEGYYFTSYAYALDKLIDTQEDMAKLVESKVLANMLGSNQKAADMINKICKNITITKFYYTQEFNEIDNYYNGYWPKNIAWLRRTYFNNPWSAIALVAAIILFSLTVVQTVFTIRAA